MGSSGLRLGGIEGSVVELDWADVNSVESYRSRSRSGRGFAVGGLVGAVLLGAIAGATYKPCTSLCFGPESRGGTVALAALIGVPLGGALGALIGLGVHTASWEPVLVPSTSFSSERTIRIGARWSPGAGR